MSMLHRLRGFITAYQVKKICISKKTSNALCKNMYLYLLILLENTNEYD